MTILLIPTSEEIKTERSIINGVSESTNSIISLYSQLVIASSKTDQCKASLDNANRELVILQDKIEDETRLLFARRNKLYELYSRIISKENLNTSIEETNDRLDREVV